MLNKKRKQNGDVDTSYNYLKLAFNQDLAEFLCISATIAVWADQVDQSAL